MKNSYLKLLISYFILSIGYGLFYAVWNLLLISRAGSGNYGYLLGSFFFSNAVFSYFSGLLSDRFGRKSLLLFARIAGAVVIFLYIYVFNLIGLFVMQILIGSLLAIDGVVSFSLVGDLSEKSNRGKHFGLYALVVGFGVAIMSVTASIFSNVDIWIMLASSSVLLLLSCVFI